MWDAKKTCWFSPQKHKVIQHVFLSYKKWLQWYAFKTCTSLGSGTFWGHGQKAMDNQPSLFFSRANNVSMKLQHEGVQNLFKTDFTETSNFPAWAKNLRMHNCQWTSLIVAGQNHQGWKTSSAKCLHTIKTCFFIDFVGISLFTLFPINSTFVIPQILRRTTFVHIQQNERFQNKGIIFVDLS